MGAQTMNKRQETPGILDSIFATANPAAGSLEQRVLRVPLARCLDNPWQYRQHYSPATIAELAANINALAFQLPETSGLQSPPLARLVRVSGDGSITPLFGEAAERVRRSGALRDPELHVQIAFGHRRLRAFRVLHEGLAAHFPDAPAEITTPAPSAEYATLPVVLVDIDDQGMAEYALTENSQREDVSAIDEAWLLQRMIDEFNLTLEDAGRKFGWSRSTVSNKIRLLRLPAAAADLVRSGQLTERHGRELVRLADAPTRVEKLAALTLKKELTVAQLAENVKWELEREKEEQEKARQLARAAALLAAGYTPPGSSEPLPADRLRADMDAYQVHTMHADRLHPCSGACPCMVAIYARFPYEHYVRINPDTPNVILACSDRARRTALEEATAKAAQAGDATAVAQADAQAAAQREARRAAEAAVAQKEARRAEIIAQADAIWQEALPQFDKQRLWNNMDFLRYAFKRTNGWWIEDRVKVAADTGALCAAILERLKEETRSYQDDAGAPVYKLDALRNLVRQLITFSNAGRKRQRAEVSQETAAETAAGPAPSDWERDWDDADEASYQDLVTGWDMNWRHLPVATDGVLNAGVTRRCLLRLIEYCPYPDMKADLRGFAEQAVAA
jgi:ParB-like chromosome segregation protein Spo0J